MIAVGFCLGTFGTTYRALREKAALIDALGFDSVWVWDHYVSWDDPREPVLEGWTTLAALAEATQRVRLGPLVANNTNRHPGRLAKVAATLHELSGGRCELGIGAGGYAGEHERFGIEQGSAAERRERLAEALEIIPALWGGEPVTFEGRHYQLKDAVCAPRQEPPPRLVVAAKSPRTARLAGLHADGLNLLQWRDRAKFSAVLEALDAGLAERGRDRGGFDLSLHPGLSDMAHDPVGVLGQWEAMGFTRALIYAAPDVPLATFEKLAQQVGL
jgi:alkanesulfonate monooxygenase SsuD/methylene tetrahydromethanopterin reductase-like flavin-dependent oxidoreductase (luciferase family)